MKSFSIIKIVLLVFPLLFAASCTKEYIENEYITNVTNITNLYTSEYYSNFLSTQQEIKEDIRPVYLKAGDTVAIIATSNAVTQSEVSNGKAILESWGLKVVEADNLYNQDGRYAGTVAERVEGLQKMIDNPNVKALIAARGGYGCAQIVDKVDFYPLERNPKWIVGYSDLTVLHSIANNRGLETIHGAMATNFSNETSVSNLKKALFGNYQEVSIIKNSDCIEGTAEGRLVGGNLSIIYSLCGTYFDYNTKNAILFIEETGEYYYAIDRMLTNLRLSGKLSYLKGVVVGQFTNVTQGSDKPLNEIILEKVRDLGIPVMYGVQAGHGSPNLPLYMGRPVKLEVNSEKAVLTFQ